MMPEVTIHIGGRDFDVSCQEGEESFLHSAAKMLDDEARVLSDQIGRMPEARMLLMAGLMLADKTAAVEDRIKMVEAKLAEREAELEQMRAAPAPEPRKGRGAGGAQFGDRNAGGAGRTGRGAGRRDRGEGGGLGRFGAYPPARLVLQGQPWGKAVTLRRFRSEGRGPEKRKRGPDGPLLISRNRRGDQALASRILFAASLS